MLHLKSFLKLETFHLLSVPKKNYLLSIPKKKSSVIAQLNNNFTAVLAQQLTMHPYCLPQNTDLSSPYSKSPKDFLNNLESKAGLEDNIDYSLIFKDNNTIHSNSSKHSITDNTSSTETITTSNNNTSSISSDTQLHTPFSTAFSNFEDAVKQDSKWVPQIIMDIPHPLIPSQQTTDIVTMFEPPPIYVQAQLLEMQYPEGTSFCFSKYNGLKDKPQLAQDIKLAALRHSGTNLKIGNVMKYNSK